MKRGQVDCHVDTAEYKPVSENADNFSKIKTYIADIRANVSKGKGLYLHSRGDGLGKTMLANAILREYAMLLAEDLFQEDWRYRDGCLLEIGVVPILFYPVRQVMGETKASWGADPATLSCDWEAYAKRAKLLVIDDFLSGFTTDWVISTIWEIVDYRYRKNKATIYTSNFPPDELRKYGSMGITMCGRIYEKSTLSGILEFRGTSYRARLAAGVDHE